MNLEKIKQVNEELAQISSITDKLNHWKTNYLDKYPTPKALHEYFESKSKEELGGNISDGLSGELRLPITQYMLIPSLHSPNYGVPLETRIEYYQWMLNFLAEKKFLEDYKPRIENELKKPLGIQIIKGELERIKRIRNKALEQIQNGTINPYSQDNITPEKLYVWYENKFYSQNEIRVENKENSYVSSVCYHHYIYPYLSELLEPKRKKVNIPAILKLTGISIKKLVSELVKRNYIDKNDQVKLQNWFKGIPLKEPIQINKPMNHFVSLITSLQEEKFIKNTKVFCRNLIFNSFLFQNETVSLDSIRNVMKENDHGRITKSDKKNFIDIQLFIEK